MLASFQDTAPWYLSNRHSAGLYCVVFNVHRCRHDCSTKHTEGKDTLNGIGDHVVISPGGGICVRVRRDGRNGSAILSVSLWSGGL